MKVYCGEEYYISHFVDGLYVLDTEDNQDWVFAPETLELPTDKKVEEAIEPTISKTETVEKPQPAKRPYTRKSL
jgi:hypothetical protein